MSLLFGRGFLLLGSVFCYLKVYDCKNKFPSKIQTIPSKLIPLFTQNYIDQDFELEGPFDFMEN